MATNIKLKRSATQGAEPSTSDLELGELALNTYDGKLYMKKTVSGTSSIVELTGQVAATSSAFAYQSFKFSASSNQTTFTGSDADSKTLAYTAGQIQVYLNGVLLDATDYTASNGSSVVLDSGAASGDLLMVLNFSGTNPFDYFKYTASNAQTTFSGNDANSNSLLYTVGNITVHLNGVLLDATDFTATNGTSVVLASGAASGDILVIHEFNETALTDVSADTSPQLSGNLDVNGNDIVSTSNGHIDIIPHGTGNVNLGTDTVLLGSSGEDVTVTTNSTGDLTLSTNEGTNSGTIVIADGANNDITITPNGTGDVIIDGLKYPQSDGSNGQVLTTNGSGQLSFSAKTSAALDDISTGDAAATLATSTGDITIDSPADIILDADGADISFKDGGSAVGSISMANGDITLTASGDDLLLVAADNINLQPQGGEAGIDITGNGGVTLYNDNSAKFTTNANGVSVTGAAIGTLTTDNDGSFDMAASNNFKCTPSGNFTLTFTNIVSQSGNILLVNSGGHTVSAHSNTKVDANLLSTVSTAGTYLLAYFSDGTDVFMTNSAIYT
tara:strand:+ start:578 stop:2254 length:1677 start_codon:yes stop_codon:yes gene_type:complete